MVAEGGNKTLYGHSTRLFTGQAEVLQQLSGLGKAGMTEKGVVVWCKFVSRERDTGILSVRNKVEDIG